MRLQHWVPPVAWMGVILLLSTDTGSAEHTGRFLVPLLRWIWPSASALQIEVLHGLVRKAAHLTEYAMLAALWFRAFIGGRGWSPGAAAGAAFGMSVAWAHVDEAAQAFTPSRTGAYADVMIDAAGALVASWACSAGWPAAVDRGVGGLLWIVALGGAVALAVSLTLAGPSGWLWLTTPVAMVALLFRHRCRRHAADRADARPDPG